MNLENTPVLWLGTPWRLGASLEHVSDKDSAVLYSSHQGRGAVVLHTECIVQCHGAKDIESDIGPSNTPVAPSLVGVYKEVSLACVFG